MPQHNRPAHVVPNFRGRAKPDYRRLNELGDAINRSHTGTPPPHGETIKTAGRPVLLTNITITIDGQGSVIAAGMDLGGATVEVQMPCTILNWTVEADASGSIVVDVTRANKGVPSSSIVGSGNKPTLSSAQYASAAPNSSWTSVQLAQGDVIGFSVSGTPATVKRVTVTLRVAY